MVARSVWITRASRPGELEGVPLGPMGVVAATLEVSAVVSLDMGKSGLLVTYVWTAAFQLFS